MNIIPIFLKELENEAVTTRKMLALVPEDKYDWKPHPKSMAMGRLATHVAEIPGWVATWINKDGIDFAKDYNAFVAANNKELMDYFEKNQAEGLANLKGYTEEQLHEKWTMRSGDYVIGTIEKHELVRNALNQTTHHRAQLGVYLRLLDIPIPGTYGPSADDMGM
jgi:uncharacterized damage-inducible protein DinB